MKKQCSSQVIVLKNKIESMKVKSLHGHAEVLKNYVDVHEIGKDITCVNDMLLWVESKRYLIKFAKKVLNKGKKNLLNTIIRRLFKSLQQ